jgi:hypothetical protein
VSALSKLADATLALPYDEIGTSWGTQKLVDVIRQMSLEEVAELRPDLAAEFAVARELAASRGAYIIATARARAADGRDVTVRVVVEDVAP